MKFLCNIAIALMAFALLPSCGGGGAAGQRPEGDTIPVKYASNLTLINHEGITEAIIRNPWDTTRTLQTLLLVPKDMPAPENTGNAVVVRTPLEKSVIYSGVHALLADELGQRKAVAGICDAEYLPGLWISEDIKSGRLQDCGSSLSPNVEKIMKIDPDAVLLSPYENSASNDKLDAMGIPVIECADYMEAMPLGRAEWVKFFGRLFGEPDRADSLFNSVESKYLGLKKIAANRKERPEVIFDRIYGNAWYVPEKYSTTGRFIEDAGGKNPFDYKKAYGSAAISPEEVLMKGGNSQFWFIRHAGETITRESLAKDNPIYRQFRAFKEDNVYECDTRTSHIFEQSAFHPQLLLEELISIIHPDSGVESSQNYFSKLK